MAHFTHYNYTWEPQLRTSIRLSLEQSADRPVIRYGLAISRIAEALTPLRETHRHIDIQEGGDRE